MMIAEIPKSNGERIHWTEYLPVCSCGANLGPMPGWYYTKRGATIRANQHLGPKFGTLAEFQERYTAPPEEFDPFA